MKQKSKFTVKSNFVRLLVNILLVYVAYFACRIAFILVNKGNFPEIFQDGRIWPLLKGGILFDTSAICYTDSLFMLLFLVAAYFKKIAGWYRGLLKWLFVVVNSLCVLVNLADTVFFSFRLQRTTAAFFSEFGGEGNLMGIAWRETVSHWYLVVLAVALIAMLWKCYMNPIAADRRGKWHYVASSLCIVIAAFFCVSGMRGSILFTKATRPISNNYAFQFTTNPPEAGIVLNTPFSVIRTLGRRTLPTPQFFASLEEAEKIYSPLHFPNPSDSTRLHAGSRKNVVVLILESFATEFIGHFNKDLDGGTYKGYTPHLDALIDSCLWHDEMIANTFYSIDAPPAVLASIPRAESPFVVSPHSVNTINSLASELKNMGYSTAFFHGAENGSLGISAFTNQAGFDEYFGKTEFLADSRFGGMAEFDGTWGIWDEPFLQFFCTKLGEMKEPFLGSVFTLSSHHPFKVPEKYKDVFTDEGEFELHKAIKYSDYALYRFFEEARKQPWFGNTIFIISADHTSSKRTHAEYKNLMGEFRIPILIYDPSGELPRGKREGIIQQIDIMPTMLNYLGYDRPYVAFGKDVLSTTPQESWAINWNDRPTYIKGDYVMVLDGETPAGMYDYKKDPDRKNNLLGKGLPEEKDMEKHVKAFVQSYLDRMNRNDITVAPGH